MLAFLLGRRLYSVWVGAAFALVVLTRSLLVSETHQAVVDIPFLALVVGALLVEVGRPRERTLVPVLLCVAGLLRPEGWLLGLAWLAYAARGQPRAQVLRWAALVLAAPLLWALGRPGGHRRSALFAARDAGPRGATRTPARGRDRVQRAARLPARRARRPDHVARPRRRGGRAASLYERTLLPAGLAAAGLLGFLALGLADLPLLIRYLLVPAVMLCLFCGLLAFGWTVVPRSDRAWRAWTAAGVICLVAVAAYAPRQARALRGEREHAVATAAIQDDLRRIADTPAFPQPSPAARRCPSPTTGRGRCSRSGSSAPRGRSAPRAHPRAGCPRLRHDEAARRYGSIPPPLRPAALRCRPEDATWRGTPRGWSWRTASA